MGQVREAKGMLVSNATRQDIHAALYAVRSDAQTRSDASPLSSLCAPLSSLLSPLAATRRRADAQTRRRADAQ
jgi:hypothetical protein